MFGSIRWRIGLSYILLILLTMAGIVFHLSAQVRNSHLASLEDKLVAEARLIADNLAWSTAWHDPDVDLDHEARRYAELLDTRVTLISAEGIVLGESQEDRMQMDNHLHRPEIQQALATGRGSSTRFSRTVGYEMMYVAVPVRAGGLLVGVARVALRLGEIQRHIRRLRGLVMLAALLATLAAALLALLVAESTARPVRRLTRVVQRMAAGDLNARLLPTSRDEVGTLTRAFNQMADHLEVTITTLAGERSRLAAVLHNMADGVLICDDEGRVQLMNPAALELLGSTRADALGRSFAQVVRDYQLIELWQECFLRREEQVGMIEVGRQGRFLQAIVTPLRGADSQACLVILQDLTRVRQSETTRREFISNISHELRTPLASLKALAETLRDGALEDPPAARRFLDRMDVEVDALTQMVRELLELSRIESGQVPFNLQPVDLAEVVGPSVERLRTQAERSGLSMASELHSDLPLVLADHDRMQQVMTNLLHNAIKFTPSGGQILISAEAQEGGEEVVVSVSDTGLGIPGEDLSRIFERFYKVDRARSGGGTGLGLAIAREIVQAHGGRIWGESVEGQGSTFHFSLRVAQP